VTRPAVLALPTRAELKRALRLSLIVTLVSLSLGLILPVAAIAQEAAQSGSAISIDLGTGAGLTERVVQPGRGEAVQRRFAQYQKQDRHHRDDDRQERGQRTSRNEAAPPLAHQDHQMPDPSV